MLKLSCALGTTIIFALAGAWQPASAQTGKPVVGVTKAPATKAHLAKRIELRNPTKLPSLPIVALPELSPDQMAIANRVALGNMPCELAAHVVVKPDMRGAGRFVLELGKQRYSMVPVPTLTGAIRLEDEAAGVVWLQLSNKSMLMSQKYGKRLADACASADQLIVAEELERNPAPSLLDAPLRLQVFAQSPAAVDPEVSVAVDDAAK